MTWLEKALGREPPPEPELPGQELVQIEDTQGEEGIRRLSGSHAPAEESYVDLYELAQRLGRLARWDRAAPLLGLGTLLAGAGLGGFVADEGLNGDARLSLFVGLAFLVGGLLLRDERRREIRHLHEDMAKRLCLYDEDPTVKAIQASYQRQEADAFAQTWRGLLLRGFRVARRARDSPKQGGG